jgi:hypothetical protein
MIEPVVIREGERPTHVVIPWGEWQRIRELIEDAADVAHAERILADPSMDWIPSELVDRMLEGEHPVKVWREHRGLTQVQLAAASDVPQPTIARIEGRERRGTVAQMTKLAGALGVRLDTLVAPLTGSPADRRSVRGGLAR